MQGGRRQGRVFYKQNEKESFLKSILKFFNCEFQECLLELFYSLDQLLKSTSDSLRLIVLGWTAHPSVSTKT